jgi:outer membrane protein assembly factor BamB
MAKKKKESHMIIRKILICFVLLTFCVGCRRPQDNEIQKRKSISDFTLHKNFIYFGAGYNLCRIDLSSQSCEALYTTDNILVEQPVVDNGIVYFGGSGYLNEKGDFGGKDSFFALDIQSKKILWKFKLSSGYGTFGTYPKLAKDRVLVCARKFLYCLNAKNGKIIWKISNWFGQDSDGIQIPYIIGNNVAYKINGDKPNKGSWAVVSLNSGKQIAIIDAPKDTMGQSLAIAYDGLLYLTTRYINPVPRNGHFGAIDITNKKLIWEIGEFFSRSRPAVNSSFVYTCKNNPIPQLKALGKRKDEVEWGKILEETRKSYQNIVALNKQTGEVVWERTIENIDVMKEKPRSYSFLQSIRLAATEEEVLVRGVKTIASYDSIDGEKLWSRVYEPDFNYANPIIVGSDVFISDLSDNSVIAIDLKSGEELWKAKVPDCSFYMLQDD